MPVTVQLYKMCKNIFKVFDQGKSLSLFAWWLGARGIMKKMTNSDIGGGGLKFGIFVMMSFLNDPYMDT